IGTGGTISSLAQSSLDVLDYPDFGRKLSSAELVERFPETGLVANVLAVPFRAVGSTAMGPRGRLELRVMIPALAQEAPPIDGFVVTHGTATREETAYFLNLTLSVPQPV